MEDLELLTVKELQDKLVELGMPQDDVEAFRTKAPLIASIRTLEARIATEEVKAEEVAEVKKVATIEERPNPAEDREVNKRHLEKAMVMKKKLLQQPTVRILIPLEAKEKAGEVVWVYTKTGERMSQTEWEALTLNDKLDTHQIVVSGDAESVQLNGYKYLIAKGRYVPVPLQVAEVVSAAQQQTLDAGKEYLLDRIDPKTGRPMVEVL